MRNKTPINYCTNCGHKVSIAVPDGDNRERHVCFECGEIQYQNPKIVAGCLPVWENRILLCKRAIEPRKGYWTIPAGFMENDESIEEGAIRETWEEALAKVTNLQLYQIYNVSRVNQIYMLFRADLCEPEGFGVGPESLEVNLVEEKDIPWDEIAFKVIQNTLERFLVERRSGHFTFSMDSIEY
jgi:ADP-ribose pyrophosphatase YjhB (NUDIX family)